MTSISQKPPNRHMSFRTGVLVFLFILLWVFWVYRHGMVGAPRSDQIPTMEERGYYKTDWDYFCHMFDFDRTRHVLRDFLKEDGFLSRPGQQGSVALLDIFFRDNLYVIGIVSIFCHALAVFFLFLLLWELTGWLAGFLLALVFATQYAGMEMVMWRNISALIDSLIFFGAALWLIFRNRDSLERNRFVLLVVLFLFASFFHETILIALLVSGVLFLILNRGTTDLAQSVKKLPLMFLCAFLINMVLALPQLLQFDQGSAAARSGHLLTWTSVQTVAFLAGLALSVFVLPQHVKIDFPHILERTSDRGFWYYSETANPYPLAGALLIVGLTVLLIDAVIQYRRGKDVPYCITVILTSVVFGILLVGLVFARLIPRGVGCLCGMTYYFYMTNYWLTLVFGFAIYRLNLLSEGPVPKRIIFYLLLIVFAATQIPFSYGRIQTLLKKRESFDVKTAQFTSVISRALRKEKDYCYGGSTSPAVTTYAFRTLLYRQTCFDEGKIPLYAVKRPDGSFWLARLVEDEKKQVTRKFGRRSKETLIFDDNPQSDIIPMPFILFASNESFDPTWYEARIESGVFVGLVLRYENERNYVVLVNHEFYFYVIVMRNGVRSPPLFAESQVFSPEGYTISLRKISGRYYVFYNQSLLTSFEPFQSFRGRVGLFNGQKDRIPVFSNVILSEDEMLYRFEPLIRLDPDLTE